MDTSDTTALLETWRDEVIYQVFIDRFAGYNPDKDPLKGDFIGGNLRGVIDNLQYIKDLGATCIYITPFFKGMAYHGYHTTDFFDIDDRFGTKEELKQLVQSAHDLGLKVMIDFVPNHCSVYHPYFENAAANPANRYRDWFFFEGNSAGRYLMFLEHVVLAKFNLDNPETAEHMIQSGEYWVKEFGIDALRLDHVIGPSINFWKQFRQRMKALKPDLFLLAEVNLQGTDMRVHGKTLNLPLDWTDIEDLPIDHKHAALMAAYGGIFDGYIDFAFLSIVQDFAAGDLTREQVDNKLERHYQDMPNNVAFLTQIDNHDSYRIMYYAHNNIDRVKEAISIQFNYKQPKIIYYGTEQGMTHEGPSGLLSEFNFDILARQPMPRLEDRNYDHPLYHHYRYVTSK